MRKIIIVITLLCVLILYLLFYRHFKTVGNTTFTIWKYYDGCIITPYVYLGIHKPQTDYILSSNVGEVLIFNENDSTFIVYDDMYGDSIVSKSLKFHFRVIRRDNNSLDDINKWRLSIDSCNTKKLSGIHIDARWMTIHNW